MATRNLSAKFVSLRAAALESRAARAAATGAAAAAAGAVDEEAGLPLVEFSDAPAAGQPPAWVGLHEQITKDLSFAREQMRILQRLHATRLRVSFGDDIIAEQEKAIESATQEITQVLLRCEGSLKQIALAGNDGTLSVQEKTTRLNVMRSLASEINQASKHFRQLQKEYLHNLKAQEVVGAQFLSAADGVSRGISLEDACDNGLTEAQVSELALMEQQASDREKEIIRIAQSVNQLATLFRELNELVIEQGTVLDRIDYNIETTLQRVQKGVKHLEDAEKESKKALTMKCIILLAITCFMLLIVFIWRKSASS